MKKMDKPVPTVNDAVDDAGYVSGHCCYPLEALAWVASVISQQQCCCKDDVAACVCCCESLDHVLAAMEVHIAHLRASCPVPGYESKAPK